MRKRADLALAGLLLALFVYQNAVVLQSELRFTADSERDLFYVLALVEEGEMPADGIRMAALGADLGPLYFLLIAPINAIWPSPQSLHLFNVVAGALGLLAFFFFARARIGAAPALVGLFLYTQSGAHGALMDTAWHVGFAPGVAWGTLAAMGWWAHSGRRLALALATVGLCVLVQIHALGSVYGPAALLLLVLGRRYLDRRSLVTLAASAGVTLIPLLLYFIPAISNPVTGAARHDGAFQFSPLAFWEGLQGLTQAKYLLHPRATAILTLTLGILGLVGTFRRPSRFRWFLCAQFVVGGAAVSSILTYESVGRYFLPVIFPLYALCCYGVADLDRLLESRGRPELGRKLTWAAMLVGLVIAAPSGSLALLLPGSGPAGARDNLDYLTLEEQELVTDYLVVERGLSWTHLKRRVHGTYFGPLTGIRYLERVRREDRGTRSGPAPKDHWLVLPDGLGAPPLSEAQELEHVALAGRHRTLHLYRYKPGVDPASIAVSGRPCPWHLPYIWSEAPADLLKLVGFPEGHGLNIHSCFPKQPDATSILEVTVWPHARSVTLQISDDGHFRGVERPPLHVTLSAEGVPPLPLAVPGMVGAEKTWFVIQLPPHDDKRKLSMELKPVGHLAFIDIY